MNIAVLNNTTIHIPCSFTDVHSIIDKYPAIIWEENVTKHTWHEISYNNHCQTNHPWSDKITHKQGTKYDLVIPYATAEFAGRYRCKVDGLYFNGFKPAVVDVYIVGMICLHIKQLYSFNHHVHVLKLSFTLNIIHDQYKTKISEFIPLELIIMNMCLHVILRKKLSRSWLVFT